MSAIHKFTGTNEDFEWTGVEGVLLTDEDLKSVTKHILIGENENAPNSIMRYFHLDPGGHSKLERHPQEHEVIILHGAGEVQIAEKSHAIVPFDVVFIEGNELHQFRASDTEEMGFICVIPK
jgi:quercetin dioxygenase-like cupin family protein